MAQYQHLGVYSDWVDEAMRQGPLYPPAAPGRETRARLRDRAPVVPPLQPIQKPVHQE